MCCGMLVALYSKALFIACNAEAMLSGLGGPMFLHPLLTSLRGVSVAVLGPREAGIASGDPPLGFAAVVGKLHPTWHRSGQWLACERLFGFLIVDIAWQVQSHSTPMQGVHMVRGLELLRNIAPPCISTGQHGGTSGLEACERRRPGK